MNIKGLVRSKTFWTGISAIIAAVAGVSTGTMDPDTAIQTALGGLVAISFVMVSRRYVRTNDARRLEIVGL